MFFNQGVDGSDNLCVTVLLLRSSVIGRPRKTDTPAAALYRQFMLGDQERYSFTFLRRP